MTVAVFPGQGSQKSGMHQTLLEKYPEYVALTSKLLDYDVGQLIIDNPQGLLNQTLYTQPCLYLVNALALIDYRDQHRDQCFKFFAGHSLGEFNALFAAGAYDYETGLKIVIKRAELMSRASAGSMVAIIGMTKQDVFDVINNELQQGIDIANYNAPTQIVISGVESIIIKAKMVFTEHGALVIPLNVSGAFHSRLMQKSSEQFAEFLADFSFKPLHTPVISNCTAQPYPASEPQQLLLVKQLTHEVKWVDSIEYLLRQSETEFVELGPGNILSGLISRIQAVVANTA